MIELLLGKDIGIVIDIVSKIINEEDFGFLEQFESFGGKKVL